MKAGEPNIFSNIEYEFGNCRTHFDRVDYDKVYFRCLHPGLHKLVCKCQWKPFTHGWEGGYIEIDGENYCQDFLNGTEKIVSVEIKPGNIND